MSAAKVKGMPARTRSRTRTQIDLFATLQSLNTRPKPFEVDTAAEIWTNPHTSARMLEFHLDPRVDAASKKPEDIDRCIAWIGETFQVGESSRVADFGCGPGLYASRLAQLGARVTGIDLSWRSLEYARAQAERQDHDIEYVEGDYLEFESEESFDVILMVQCDFCGHAPQTRQRLLRKFAGLLKPSGVLLLDVYSLAAFDLRREVSGYEKNLLDGIWSPHPYYGFLNSFKYPAEKLALDQYTIVEPSGIKTIYNWFQSFSPETLAQEFSECGLEIHETYGDLTGTAYGKTKTEFAVAARRTNTESIGA